MSLLGFNPYSPGFSIYLVEISNEISWDIQLQSLFTWIFYLFENLILIADRLNELQSLFTWIFYLFLELDDEQVSKLVLQSLFTWIFYLFINMELYYKVDIGFNPYSPGFSIYLHSKNKNRRYKK